ncbi:MAG: hypothetical protein ACT4OG_09570 [Alphaproteobacteria bacterium]
MELGLYQTIGLLALALALAGFSYWRAHRPAVPLKVPFMNYHYLMLFSIIFAVFLAVHLVSLITGKAVTGPGFGQ